MNPFRKGIAGGIPIALGYFAVSFSFGILAVKGGISPLAAAVISLTNVTSAGQFAGLTIILTSGSLWEMALTQFIINLRYSLMSLSISQKLDSKLPLWHRFLMAFGMTDEIFGISAVQKDPLAPSFMYGAMAVAIPGWVLGNTNANFYNGGIEWERAMSMEFSEDGTYLMTDELDQKMIVDEMTKKAKEGKYKVYLRELLCKPLTIDAEDIEEVFSLMHM